MELEASFVAPLSAQMVIAAELWLEANLLAFAKGQFLGVILLQRVTALQGRVELEVSFVAPAQAWMVTAADGWLEFLGVVRLLRQTALQGWVEPEATFGGELCSSCAGSDGDCC